MTSPFSTTYAPAREDHTLARLRPRYELFIDGEHRPSAAGITYVTYNPATGAPLASVAEASVGDVNTAVAAARAALPRWAALTGAKRAEVLFRVARLIAERSRELAVLESLDGGKAIIESRDFDVPTAAQHFFHYAGWADKISYANLDDVRPVGVCAQIIPWNFPLLMAAWKVAPALAVGNTVVLKPAETTPLTALILAEICAEAGVPAGVLNVVCGAGDIGEALVTHEGVDKVAFTGSTAVGRRIAGLASGTDKRATLELGGKSANIVFDDASIDAAVEGVVSGIFFNSGHVCCAGSRLLVAESIASEFTDRLADRMARIRVGDPLDKNTDMGAINSPTQLTRIRTMVAAAASEGAEVRSAHAGDLPDAGSWFAPTLLVGVEPAHSAARTEIFGPVLSVMTFRTPAEAVERANDSTYGLAAGVWTEKASKAQWVSSRLRAGVVWVNTYNRFDPTSPFGGFRESGYGREGGRHGLEAYTGPTARTSAELDASRTADQVLHPIEAPADANGADQAPEMTVFGRPGGGCTYAPLSPAFAQQVKAQPPVYIDPAAAADQAPEEVVFGDPGSGCTYAPLSPAFAAQIKAQPPVYIDFETSALTAPSTLSPARARKTVKLFIGGAFARSESAATVPVTVGPHTFEVPAASRKDARDAVTAALKAQPAWAARAPYNRGQILYRVAEMAAPETADAVVAVDRWAHWAGWCDKLGHVLGSVNDVADPYQSTSSPVPVGIVAVIVPAGSGLDEFTDAVAPALAAGNAVVAVVDPGDLALLMFAETFAISDMPAGVINIVTAARPEVAATLAAHSAVTALDLTGHTDTAAAATLEELAAANLTRVRRPGAPTGDLARLRAVTETRTIWSAAGR